MVRLTLLTGATGYVGGRLLGALEARGGRVRCLVRRPDELRGRAGESTEIVAGDVFDPASLKTALDSVDTAYYLVHSMGGDDFEERDRQGARNFAFAARDAGVRHVIYLGGLAHGHDLSPHLASRQEVGRILREALATTELRASIVIGSGSLSFDIVRALVDRLPVMITPRWVRRLAQPIAIEDVITYLVAALDRPGDESEVFEIGGAEAVSYLEIMREYARQRGLRRLMIPVPVLTPYISSLWLALITPVYASTGRKLIDSLRQDTVVRDDAALRMFPVRPRGIAAAVERALRFEDREFAETRWSDALSARTPRSFGGERFRSRLVDSRSLRLAVPPAAAFEPIVRIGGASGWYYGNALWRLRGFIDLLVGGVGSRRGRRSPDRLSRGETLDFWRVETIEPGRLLRLRAEMRLPGRAWLQFEVVPIQGGSEIRQTAEFDPVGLLGLAYWYGLWPLHKIVFAGMLHGIGRAAHT
jgi:uncharacterized protein YbjT (DUF2867 family)